MLRPQLGLRKLQLRTLTRPQQESRSKNAGSRSGTAAVEDEAVVEDYGNAAVTELLKGRKATRSNSLSRDGFGKYIKLVLLLQTTHKWPKPEAEAGFANMDANGRSRWPKPVMQCKDEN